MKTIEAYGVKGLGNKSWRKSFKNRATLVEWAEKNDAEIYGTRKTDEAIAFEMRMKERVSE